MIITKSDNPHYADMRCKHCGGYLYRVVGCGPIHCSNNCGEIIDMEDGTEVDAVWVDPTFKPYRYHLMKFIG